RRVDPVHLPAGGRGDDHVERAAGTQRAVRQLGGEGRVPTVQPQLAQVPGQDEVAVRPVAVYGRDRLVRRLPRLVHHGTATARPVARTGPSLTRSPRNVVHAPGAGVPARIRRSTANAGSAQRTWTSSTVILGAMVTPSAGCGTADSAPASIPSRTSTSSRAPDTASRSSRSPEVSVGRTGSVCVPKTGPVSSPASSWKTDAPATSSPCSTACWTGAAPRHAGSSEKCRLTQPYRGMSSAAGGTSAPYATTGT